MQKGVYWDSMFYRNSFLWMCIFVPGQVWKLENKKELIRFFYHAETECLLLLLLCSPLLASWFVNSGSSVTLSLISPEEGWDYICVLLDPASSSSGCGNLGFQTHVAGASPADQFHSFTAKSKTILKCKVLFFFFKQTHKQTYMHYVVGLETSVSLGHKSSITINWR